MKISDSDGDPDSDSEALPLSTALTAIGCGLGRCQAKRVKSFLGSTGSHLFPI